MWHSVQFKTISNSLTRVARLHKIYLDVSQLTKLVRNNSCFEFGETYERTKQVPGDAWRHQTHYFRGPVKPGLVAKAVEPENPAPEFGPVESDGAGLQLCRSVQDCRS